MLPLLHHLLFLIDLKSTIFDCRENCIKMYDNEKEWEYVFGSEVKKTRTKTSIRYAKENDREKERERKKGRRDIKREGEIER